MAIEQLMQNATLLTGFITQRVVTPLLILFVGLLIGRTVRNAILKLTASVELDSHVTTMLGGDYRIGETLAALAAVIIYVFTIAWSLHAANILRHVTYGVAILLGSLLLIGLLLWIHDFLPNAFASLWIRKHIAIDQQVHVADITGSVVRKRILHVLIVHGTEYYSIPNKTVKAAMLQRKTRSARSST